MRSAYDKIADAYQAIGIYHSIRHENKTHVGGNRPHVLRERPIIAPVGVYR